jgi:hypothetical protein
VARVLTPLRRSKLVCFVSERRLGVDGSRTWMMYHSDVLEAHEHEHARWICSLVLRQNETK